MLEAALAFLCTLSPGWVFMIFPLIFGSIAFSCWRGHRKREKLKANPHRMNTGEYMNFNWDRFNK